MAITNHQHGCRQHGPALFVLGLAFTLFLISLPALAWGSFRLLQLAGLLS